jgi:hypothetical protein
MRKIDHVPVQTWKAWNPDDLLGRWFSTIGGFKIMFGVVLIIVLGCLILSCLLPLLMQQSCLAYRYNNFMKSYFTILSSIEVCLP